MPYPLDTHAAIQNLTAAGIEPAHAEAIVATMVRSYEADTAEGDVPILGAHLDVAVARLEARIVAREHRTLLAGVATAVLLFAALRSLG